MSAFEGLTLRNAAYAPQTGRVQQAIATASRRTGVDFGYLVGQAQIESSMNPNARASTSSATGLYQFLDQSWLAVVNEHGADHGMGWASEAIQKNASGRYYVADPQMRQQIMNLRNHPETASVMAAELASDNRDYLQQRTGRTAEPVDLYLAHFLGAGGASKFLNAMQTSPNASGASLFPAAARANASIFYDRQGNARSLTDIRSSFAQKLENGAQKAGSTTGTYAGSSTFDMPADAPTVAPADYLRIAQQRLGVSQIGDLADPSSTDVIDPQTTTSSAASDDAELIDSVQQLALGRSYSPLAPRAETARLAYLMLATFGR